MKLEKQKANISVKKWVKDFLLIIIGCMIMAIGTSLFLLPNQLSSGGFSGLATIIYYLFGFPLGTTMLILNIPLFVMAFIRVGKETTIKGIIGTAVLAFFIDLFDNIEPLTSDRVLACIYGGICIGIGTAIILGPFKSSLIIPVEIVYPLIPISKLNNVALSLTFILFLWEIVLNISSEK